MQRYMKLYYNDGDRIPTRDCVRVKNRTELINVLKVLPANYIIERVEVAEINEEFYPSFMDKFTNPDLEYGFEKVDSGEHVPPDFWDGLPDEIGDAEQMNVETGNLKEYKNDT